MKKLTFFLSLVVFAFLNSFSQTTKEQITEKRKCATYEVHHLLIQNDPTYLDRYNKLQKFVNDFVAAHPEGYSYKAVVTVPVVFHIVLSSAQMSSFPDSRLQEQITVLNQDYGGQNTHSMGSFATSLKANTELQFCLAQQDPSGNSTTGIEHRTSTHGAWGMSADIKHTSTGGMDQWNPNKYLNIWVCDLGGGLCGWAQYPTAPLSNEFGLVCHYEYVGVTGASAPYNLGGTVTHEIGHCFNLQHIWGDSGGCSPDDNCSDTPVQDVETYGAPTGVVTDACSTTSPGIMYMNFMDYVDDISYANFTPNQKTRIQACFAVGGPLEQLGQSTACGNGSSLTANFTGNPTTIPVGGSVNFIDQSTGNITNWKWIFQGGSPSSSTQQNPTNITYNTVGIYDVTLIISNGITYDTLIKNNYIYVNSSNNPIANFIGNPLTINIGDSVNFTDLSTNNPTDWVWSFNGGSPSFYSGQSPPPIIYNVAGDYNVSLYVSNGSGSDSELKTAYIHVVPPTSQVPTADFVSNPTTLLVGGTVNFTDLSTNIPQSWQWKFLGGSPSTANVQNPTSIQYNTAGTYWVSLTVANSNGSDSLKKTAYIKVLNDYGTQVPVVDFTASVRLITVGTTIYFTDLSTNNPSSWNWYFSGASPSSSTLQNPFGITYNNPGFFAVTLKAENPNGSDSLTKTDYIVVTPSAMTEYCDTLSNIQPQENIYYLHLTNTIGYLPGQNGYGIKAYADKYTNYTFNEISAIIIPVCISKHGSSGSYVRFKIWGGSNLPLDNEVLGYKDKLLSSMPPNYYVNVTFNPPVLVNGTFFIGYEVQYTVPGDTFVVAMAHDRGVSGLNTLYVRKNNNVWASCPEVFDITTSLALYPIVCLTGTVESEEIYEVNDILIFPNPAHNIINIEIQNNNFLKNVDFKIYDIVGKSVDIPIIKKAQSYYQLDFSGKNNGIYFIQIQKGDKIIVKKVSIIR